MMAREGAMATVALTTSASTRPSKGEDGVATRKRRRGRRKRTKREEGWGSIAV